MPRVTLDLQMSSDDALTTVVTALQAIPDVTVSAGTLIGERHVTVTVQSDDPDAVEIVREITWQFDPLAIQHSLLLDEAS